MSVFSDQLNRRVEIPEIPKRVISLVPSQTELLVDLGLEESIVGITKFCVHPEHLRKKKSVVGGTKKVKFEKIRSLRPDLILCNKEENTREMVLELEKVAPVHVSDIKNTEDALKLTMLYGKIFGKEEKAAELSQEIFDAFTDFQEFMRDKPRRKAAYFIWQKPYMVAGGDTFIDHLLEVNNFENVFRNEASRYPEVELEELKKRGVSLILLSTEPFPFCVKQKEEFQQIFNERDVEIVDGEFFSWYGSRLRLAFPYFKSLYSYLRSS